MLIRFNREDTSFLKYFYSTFSLTNLSIYIYYYFLFFFRLQNFKFENPMVTNLDFFVKNYWYHGFYIDFSCNNEIIQKKKE